MCYVFYFAVNRGPRIVSTAFCQRQERRGGAVAATLTGMILLAVLAVAFLKMATKTAKSAHQDRASGLLPRGVGLNQRVSAAANILSENEGFFEYPHRADIWKTTQTTGSNGFWVGDIGVKANLRSLNPDRGSEIPNFGRRFLVRIFRWLDPNEV